MRDRTSPSTAETAQLDSEAQPQRKVGVLLRLKEEGYGFIRPDAKGRQREPDYYVNICEMRDRADWQEGRAVSFLPGKPQPGSRKAPRASDVAACTQQRHGVSNENANLSAPAQS